MAKTLHQLGRMLREKRGARTLREIAAELDVSPSTLSRIERGKLPDLETFPKICRWLNLDPREVLGLEAGEAPEHRGQGVAAAHFRASRNVTPELAMALGELIMRVQQLSPDEG